jgi:hypothetical protein
MELTAREYLTDLLLKTEGYDAVDRKTLKRDLASLSHAKEKETNN